jgi:hypothetical protein
MGNRLTRAKWPRMTSDERAALALRIGKRCHANANACLAMLSFETAGRTNEVAAAFSGGQHVGHLMALTTNWLALMQVLMRLHDRPTRSNDIRTMDSLPVLFALLGDKRVRARVTRNGLEPEMAVARSDWTKLKSNRRIKRRLQELRNLRDRAVAHSLHKRRRFSSQTKGAVIEVVRLTIPIVIELVGALRIKASDLYQDEGEWMTQATDFWRRVVRGSRS